MFRNAVTRFSFIAIMLFALALILAVNRWWEHDLPEEPFLRVARLRQANLYERAESIFVNLVAEDPASIDISYRYINNHFDVGRAERRSRDAAHPAGNDQVESHFQQLAESADLADIGNYGLGLIRVLEQRFEEAFDYYALVRNRRLKYLNNSVGYLYLKQRMIEGAEAYCRKEIDVQGNIEGAVSNLVNIYSEQSNWSGLGSLLESPVTRHHVNPAAARTFHFRAGNPLTYLSLCFIVPLSKIQIAPALVALFIGAMWFVYFRRVDVFEHEPVVLAIVVLVLGGLSALLSALVSDTVALLYPIGLNGNVLNDLCYSIIHIGFVEELVKLIPVVLIVMVSRQVNEPMDMVYYGSLSALGFATLENSLYFTGYGLGIAFVRFLFSTVIHMVMTSIICYRWAKARFIRRGSTVLAIAAGFLVAAVIHGLFDYFIIGPLNVLSILSLVMVMVLAGVYARMITNALNFSPFFDAELATAKTLHNFNLLLSTSAVLFIIIYLYNNFYYSTEIANRRILELIGTNVISVIVVFGALGAFRVRQGILTPIFRFKRT